MLSILIGNYQLSVCCLVSNCLKSNAIKSVEKFGFSTGKPNCGQIAVGLFCFACYVRNNLRNTKKRSILNFEELFGTGCWLQWEFWLFMGILVYIFQNMGILSHALCPMSWTMRKKSVWRSPMGWTLTAACLSGVICRAFICPAIKPEKWDNRGPCRGWKTILRLRRILRRGFVYSKIDIYAW